MPQVSRMFFKASAVFLVIGLLIGLQMSISGEHNVTGAHAHLSLLGWVSGALFGIYYALSPARAARRLALAHFWAVTIASAVMSGALYLLLLGNTAMVPIVAAGSLLFLAGSLLFLWIVFAPAGDDVPGAQPSMTG